MTAAVSTSRLRQSSSSSWSTRRRIAWTTAALVIALWQRCPTASAAAAAAANPASRSRSKSRSADDPYALLSTALVDKIALLRQDGEQQQQQQQQPGITCTSKPPPTAKSIRRALQSLSSAQSALKGIDGASHELYQRTHRTASSELTEDDSGPAGRAARSAARLGCVADGLFACELCECVERPEVLEQMMRGGEEEGAEEEDMDDTLTMGGGREVWLNTTVESTSSQDVNDDGTTTTTSKPLSLRIVVLYEKLYDGGAGFRHGGIDGVLSEKNEGKEEEEDRAARGRLLVILGDDHGNDLPATVKVLDEDPRLISLDADGLMAEANLPASARMASVHGGLYDAARSVLETIRPSLERAQRERKSAAAAAAEKGSEVDSFPPSQPFAIHFVGRSLAGGVAALAAAALDGMLPIVDDENEDGKDDDDDNSSSPSADEEDDAQAKASQKTKVKSLCGYGRGRCSAFALGPPPCLSNNIKADFVKSVIHGDDVICRTTKQSLDRLCQRTHRVMKGNVIGAKMSFLSNAVSLTVSGVKQHAKGKKGGEKQLAIPGTVYLVRPRRYEGSSIHEVTSSDGAIKVRSAVLWQLNDLLLSKSLWAHHKLDAYIRGLDRVQLRSFAQSQDQQP